MRTTFQYIDKLLSEAEHTMADAGSLSPFRRHSDDTTPIQRKVTHDYILRIREAMRRVMEELNIPPPEPHSGAVWAAAINLMFCSISLNELTPKRMRAYGPLSPEAADSIRSSSMLSVPRNSTRPCAVTILSISLSKRISSPVLPNCWSRCCRSPPAPLPK